MILDEFNIFDEKLCGIKVLKYGTKIICLKKDNDEIIEVWYRKTRSAIQNTIPQYVRDATRIYIFEKRDDLNPQSSKYAFGNVADLQTDVSDKGKLYVKYFPLSYDQLLKKLDRYN